MSATHDDAAGLTTAIRTALAKVIDPELRRPITELGMVKSIDIGAGGNVHVGIYLTTAGCPKKSEITEQVTRAVTDVPGTGKVTVSLDVMSDEQRTELRKLLRGPNSGAAEPVIPFAQPSSLTRVYAVASGKGGVGKSTVTVNLAAAMAARGLSVGVLDADIHGHSIPRMMGSTDRPTQVESMILPPIAHEVKVISIAQFTQDNTPVVWRGPMLHRALQQFLADVYWGDLDVLLLDLPPGTGDVAISLAQLLPNAEILVVTTPQLAAAEVAERAGSIAIQTRQRIVGVVENMSGLTLPDGSTLQVFGEGGGRQVAERLSRAVGADVPLLGQIPLDPALVAAGDAGVPVVLSAPTRRSARSSAASPTPCRRGGAAWQACHSGWIRPGDSRRCNPAVLLVARFRSLVTLAATGYVASVSNGVRSGGGGGSAGAGGAGGWAGGSKLPVKIESSPSSRCLVSAARGVMPRNFCSSLSCPRMSSNSGPMSSRSWLVIPLR